MRKSIVLEGNNGSGKSTLARQLHDMTGMNVLHASKPDHVGATVKLSFDQLSRNNLIFDRSHPISSLVYQANVLTKRQKDVLYDLAYNQGEAQIVIYCIGQGERDINKSYYTPELVKATADQEKICELYDMVMQNVAHQKYNFEINEISCLQLC